LEAKAGGIRRPAESSGVDIGQVESLEEDLGAVIAAEATISIFLYENL